MTEPAKSGGAPAASDQYVQSLARGLAVIRAFDTDHPKMTLTEVAARTGMKPVSVRANLFKARSSIRARFLATHPSYSELRK